MKYLENGTETREANTEQRPQILLLGDSIREGYCKYVKEFLKDSFDVCYPEENCRNTQYTFISLGFWKNVIGPAPLAIHFNCGHWDIAHWGGDENSLNSPEVYADMLVRIVERLGKMYPNSKIFFATTTPMNPNRTVGANPRTTEEIIKYNKIAVQKLEPLGVQIDDLFHFTESFGEEYYVDYCHFTNKGFEAIGKQVANYLLENL